MYKSIILFVAVLFAGIIAGGQYVVFFDYNPAETAPSLYALKMQRAINVIGTPLFSVQIATGVTTILAAIVLRKEGIAYYLILGAAILCIVAPLLTFFGAIPLLNEMSTWNGNSPPSDWYAVAQRWWQIHVVRFAIQLAAFLMLLAASFSRNFRPR